MKKILLLTIAALLLTAATGCSSLNYSSLNASPQAAQILQNAKDAVSGGDAQPLSNILSQLQSEEGVCVKLNMFVNSGIATISSAVVFYQQGDKAATVTDMFGGRQRSVIAGDKLYVMLDDKKAMSVLNISAAGALPINRQVLPTIEDLQTFGEPAKTTIAGVPCLKYTGDKQGVPMYFYVNEETSQPVRFEITYSGAAVTIDYETFELGNYDEQIFTIPTDYKNLTYSDLAKIPSR